MMNHKDGNFWMVVWNQNNGDVKNALINTGLEQNLEVITHKFENENPEYKVIYIGEGVQPPKTYRSLEYIN